MRVHIVGSEPAEPGAGYPDRNDANTERGLREHAALWNAAADLGRQLAERGHTMLVGSEYDLTVDHHAVNRGLVEVARRHPSRTFHLEVWRPEKRPVEGEKPKPPPFVESLKKSAPNVRVTLKFKRPGFDDGPRRDPRQNVQNTSLWSYAHQSAIANADIVVGLGGGSGTERALLSAEQVGVAALPVSTFGGGAARAHHAMKSKLRDLEDSHVLSTAWSTDRALELTEMIEREGTHSYFISYAHAHVEWADLVHLALYDRGRVVLRDWNQLRLGANVQNVLMDTIGRAETFLLLWSAEAAKSKWVKKEIDRALDLRALGLPPRRIVVLQRDSTPVPQPFAQDLWMRARNRETTDAAVNELLRQEPFGSSGQTALDLGSQRDDVARRQTRAAVVGWLGGGAVGAGLGALGASYGELLWEIGKSLLP